MTVKKFFKSKIIGENTQPLVMGVINCSPESFYTPSIKITARDLTEYTLKLVEDGADIIDIGAASTAPVSFYPGSKYVSEEEELKRVEEALPYIRDCTSLPISVDTMRAKVAEKALRLGAEIINDVSGLKKDKNMKRVIEEYSPYVILMASRREPGDISSINQLIPALRESINIALEAKAEKSKIIIDPGFGFGKSVELNIQILKNIHRLKALRKPILVGLSRKVFIKTMVNSDSDEDVLTGSTAATILAILKGANIIRTHDVRQVKTVSKFISKYNLIK
ncbi:MAG: dihydropteroate synthase [Candidatus Odinarchaeota archaeon]